MVIVTTLIQISVQMTIATAITITCLRQVLRRADQHPEAADHSGATYRLYAQPGVDRSLEPLSTVRKISGSSA